MKLKYVNFGIASRQGDTIYLNNALNSHSTLRKAILNHEEAHTSGFGWKDISLDLKMSHLRGLKRQYWAFVWHNPSSWIEFSPICKYNNKIVINPLLSMFYSLILILLGGIGWILKI